GERFFGIMDAEWRDYVWRVNPYQFPTEWPAADYLRIFVAFGVAWGVCRSAACPERVRRFLLLLALVTALGVGGGLPACRLPSALLFQVQLYRGLWLLGLLDVALAVLLAAWWGGGGRLVRRRAG